MRDRGEGVRGQASAGKWGGCLGGGRGCRPYVVAGERGGCPAGAVCPSFGAEEVSPSLILSAGLYTPRPYAFAECARGFARAIDVSGGASSAAARDGEESSSAQTDAQEAERAAKAQVEVDARATKVILFESA